MRISKHDVPVDCYTVESTPDAEGYMVRTLTQVVSGEGMDLQPIGGKVILKEYGLEAVEEGSKVAYYDLPILTAGMVCKSGGKTYMVKGVKDWYNYSKAILEPWNE